MLEWYWRKLWIQIPYINSNKYLPFMNCHWLIVGIYIFSAENFTNTTVRQSFIINNFLCIFKCNFITFLNIWICISINKCKTTRPVLRYWYSSFPLSNNIMSLLGTVDQADPQNISLESLHRINHRLLTQVWYLVIVDWPIICG